MARSFLRAGGTLSDFWQLTPRQYLAHMIEHHHRERSRHDGDTSMAWLTALLSRQKKIPRLAELLGQRAVAMTMAEAVGEMRAAATEKRTWTEWHGSS